MEVLALFFSDMSTLKEKEFQYSQLHTKKKGFETDPELHLMHVSFTLSVLTLLIRNP